MIIRMIGGFIFAIGGSIFLIHALIEWQYYTTEGMIYALIVPLVLYILAGWAFYSGIQAKNKVEDAKSKQDNDKSV